MASTYQDVLVDALRDALDRDRPPPTTPTVPDDVKSVAVQTLADENDNRESCDSGTGPTVAAPRVCPACRRAPASWRACGECQRICADGGSSNGDDDDELPPSRTLARCLLRSKTRCLFRTWRSGVRSCAKERRDVMKATTHRVGVIFRTWRQAKRSIRAAEHAEHKAVTHHRKRTLKLPLAAWRRSNQTTFYVNHRLRSRHQTKVTDGALARYVRVRNLAPAWRAWWIFHVQCATARDCINHLGEANSREFFLRSAVFGKWRMSTHLTRRERTERAAAAVDAKADEVLRREQALESTTSDIIGEHVEKINVQLRRALTNEADLAKKLASMERELREKDAVIEGNARSMKSTLENAEDFEATLARRAVEVGPGRIGSRMNASTSVKSPGFAPPWNARSRSASGTVPDTAPWMRTMTCRSSSRASRARTARVGCCPSEPDRRGSRLSRRKKTSWRPAWAVQRHVRPRE